MSDERWTLPQYLASGAATDVILVKITHFDGPVYLWNGVGMLDYNGQTWSGTGRLGAVSLGPSDTETQVTEVTFTLSGVDPEYLDLLETTVKGNTAWVWKAFLDDAMQVRFTELVSESVLDQPVLTADPNGTISMKIAANGGFYFIERQSSAVWDVEEQNNFLVAQGLDPATDTGFDLMAELKNTKLAWLPS